MRKTSDRRTDKSTREKRRKIVHKTRFYIKEQKNYTPPTQTYVLDGRPVPGYTLEEANAKGLATRHQLAEKIGCSPTGVSHWLKVHGILADAVIKQPKYGHHQSNLTLLYPVAEVIEQFKLTPIKPRKKDQDGAQRNSEEAAGSDRGPYLRTFPPHRLRPQG